MTDTTTERNYPADAGYFSESYKCAVEWARLANEALSQGRVDDAQMWLDMIADVAAKDTRKPY